MFNFFAPNVLDVFNNNAMIKVLIAAVKKMSTSRNDADDPRNGFLRDTHCNC